MQTWGSLHLKSGQPCTFFSPQAKPLAHGNITQQTLEMDMAAQPSMESTALFDEISGVHQKKSDVCSVQQLANVYFKCAHIETFQTKNA